MESEFNANLELLKASLLLQKQGHPGEFCVKAMGLVCLKGLFAVCNSFIFSLPKVLSLIDQDRNCVINWSW